MKIYYRTSKNTGVSMGLVSTVLFGFVVICIVAPVALFVFGFALLYVLVEEINIRRRRAQLEREDSNANDD